MKVAFTGPQKLEKSDFDKIAAEIDDLSAARDTLITGACVGADAYIAEYGFTSGFVVHTIVPCNRSKVAYDWDRWCETSVEMPHGTDYRQRNEEMVKRCDLLIAFIRVEGRNGETMTRNIARRLKKPVREVTLR